jgi:hypothetical protein
LVLEFGSCKPRIGKVSRRLVCGIRWKDKWTGDRQKGRESDRHKQKVLERGEVSERERE